MKTNLPGLYGACFLPVKAQNHRPMSPTEKAVSHPLAACKDTMLTIKRAALLFLFVSMPTLAFAGEIVDSTAALVSAVRSGAEGAIIEIRNNQLTNVSDADRYGNPRTGQHAGLQSPLQFECGVHGEFTVDGWQAQPSAK